jgi:formylglycine-generating enzyme required for sulfatase activity
MSQPSRILVLLGILAALIFWFMPSCANEPDIEPEMVRIPGGTFRMGSNNGNDEEKPVHRVTVSDFYMGKYEVTNAQYCAFLNEKGNQSQDTVAWLDTDGSWGDEYCRIYAEGDIFKVEKGYENYPVIYVSWYGAKAYCDWLSEKTGKKYRLPTEAEWEYAAGNGEKHTKYSWGDEEPAGKKGGNVADETFLADEFIKKKLSSIFNKNVEKMRELIFRGYTDGYIYTAPVGQFNANEFRLHDMTGNVWEWCQDWLDIDYYKNSPSSNPQGPDSGRSRICRGGSWDDDPSHAWVASRGSLVPNRCYEHVGFRIVGD